MGLRFKQVDVFTDKPFLGNPVAVVLGADALEAEAMQRIARWTNLSETTFILKSTVADYRLRIFTPSMELPFAGHPTIGSAHAALEWGVVAKDRLKQECGAGLIELSVEEGKIFLKGPSAKTAALGAIPGIETLSAPEKIDVGPVWVIGEVRDARALAALKPDMAALAAWSEKVGATGVTVFAKSDDCVARFHVRSFAPLHGIPEDPVCGSGNLSVAAFLKGHGTIAQGEAYVARQGAQLGRDGRIFVRVDPDGIRIGGHAVTCVDGQIAGG